MPLTRVIVGALTLLPVLELVAFVLVAVGIGFGPALLLLLGLSAVGGIVLSRAGRAQMAEFRRQLSQTGPGTVVLDPGRLVIILAGLLLVIPGFITASLGMLLLLAPPPWRAAAIRRASRAYGGRPRQPPVVDLDPAEWRIERPDGPTLPKPP